MEYGYVCVSNSKKEFQAKVIKFVTRSKWSHSFITVPNMLDVEMALESASSGVSMCSFDKHYRTDDGQGYRVYRFKADQGSKDKSIVSLLTELQTGYGFLELPWFAWRAICAWLKCDIRAQDNWSQAGTICSELVAQYITNAGYPQLFTSFGKGSVNAQDIFEICESHPEIFELVENKD